MSKFEESFQRRYTEAFDFGMKNEKIIQCAKTWCKHFRAGMKSPGFIGQISALPIGLIEISCQYADQFLASVNLPWIVPSFIIENCAGCPQHEPNGDVSWGEEIIENHKQQVQEQAKAEQARNEELRAVRERLRELPHQAKEDARLDEREVLTYIERLFSEDEKQQEDTAKLLIQAARIGADLFSDVAINILVEQSLSQDFASKCLPICVNLAEHREDYSSRFETLALTTINKGIYPEFSAQILLHLGQSVGYPLEDQLIKNLISQQIHYRYLGDWNDPPPSYSNIINILINCYDADKSSVIKLFQLFLKEDDKYFRVNVCEALKLLQNIRPQIGIDLLPELTASLDLYDDPYEESADTKVKQCIVKSLYYTPVQVDEYLISVMFQKRPAVQEEIVDIYCMAVQNNTRNRGEEPHGLSETQVEKVSTNRCLELVKDELLDINVRYKASECLKSASYWHPEAIISKFDALLGYYALICTQDQAPSQPPRIILPGQESQDPLALSLNEQNRIQMWGSIKNKLLATLEVLAEGKPKIVGEIVISCYQNIDTKTHEKFKSALLNILAQIGKEYSLQPKILPLLMDGLMDFKSQLIRSSAIRAVQEMYRYSISNPPKNIVDVLIVHLRDTYVIVHKAAIEAFRWHGSWLSEEQAIEAFDLMVRWLYTYKEKVYDLSDIAESIMDITQGFADLKSIGIQHIATVIPTNKESVDKKIVENMVRHIDPSEPTAIIVARQVSWFLVKYDRNRYNVYEFSERGKMFQWLHELSYIIYENIKSDLFESAKLMAEKDALEACYFASLFAKHEDYSLEKEILILAANSLGTEQSYSKFKYQLQLLSTIAAINSYIQNGNINEAHSLVLKTREITT